MSQKTRIRREQAREVRAKAEQRRRQRRLLLLGATGAALIGIVAVAVFTVMGSSASKAPFGVVSPGSTASAGQQGLSIGAAFPGFAVTEVDGHRLTPDSLKGKVSIIWFTTSYCIPCQVGAKQVAQLDNQLGGNAFNVLVVFVDPREAASDLRSWRQQFGRADWMVALDTGLAQTVGLRYLDTKYLLDKQGVIENVDVNIADEHYLDLIRNAVQRAA